MDHIIPDGDLPDLLSSALDEVYLLRAAAAVDAGVIPEHLALKTFPVSRRRIAEQQVERMFLAARGQVDHAYGGTSYLSLDHAMREAGAPAALLTTEAWATGRAAEGNGPRRGAVTVEYRAELNRAVREIGSLRRALAYEAGVLLVHTGYASFPKSRRPVIDTQVARLRAAAGGDRDTSYSGVESLQDALAAAGANRTLTLWQWLDEAPSRRTGLSE